MLCIYIMSGLTSITIHCNIPLNVEEIVNIFIKKKQKNEFYMILNQKHFKSAYYRKMLDLLLCILFNN
jgi:hypothetical protein